MRAKSAVDRADVCLMLIDANEGASYQDERIAGISHEAGKATIIAVNKWDLIEKDNHTMNVFRKKLAVDFSFMSYAPYVFISAQTGQRIDKLFELVKTTLEQNSTRIGTGRLNDMLAYATSRVQPPTDRGRRLKLYYITQAEVKPPTFVVFCNKLDLFHFSYQRYIENQIREAFGLDMTPIKIIPRERDGS
jgi:GTP-binding protein